jgi:hypothetical protein
MKRRMLSLMLAATQLYGALPAFAFDGPLTSTNCDGLTFRPTPTIKFEETDTFVAFHGNVVPAVGSVLAVKLVRYPGKYKPSGNDKGSYEIEVTRTAGETSLGVVIRPLYEWQVHSCKF